MAVFTNFRRGTLTSLVTRLQRTCHRLSSLPSAYNPFTTFSIPHSITPKNLTLVFTRVYFIIIHKNPALCVGRVHTSSYCKTVTLTSTGVVSFFNKNDMKALQFTCRKYISCKFVTVKMPDKIWFANFCYWDKLFIAPD